MAKPLSELTTEELAAQEEGLFLSLMADLVPPEGWPILLKKIGRHRAIVEELIRRYRAEVMDRVTVDDVIARSEGE